MQGFPLCILALFQAFPIAYAVAEHHVRWQGYLWSAGITLAAGIAFLAVGRVRPFHLSVRQLFAATTLSWLMIGGFAALPFLLAIGTMSFTDAVFESISGLTTTGSTVLTDLEHMPRSILLWRGIIQWLSALFMVLAALPFLLYLRMTGGDRVALFRDQQVRGYLALILVLVSLVTLDRSVFEHAAWFSALTHTVFNVVSVITTTGYASEDYILWGEFSVMAMFFVTFIGGCLGSTGGGIKMFRFQIGALMLWNQIRLMVHPHAVVANRYSGNIIGEDVVRSVVAFAFFFALTVVAIALALSLMEIDMVTSLSGAATAVANVGPGLGHIIGPAGNFAGLPDAAKWVLATGTLLGRLEILTVLILISPVFWRG